MKYVVQILKDAKALISDPRNWAQGYLSAGESYCMLGAIIQTQKSLPQPFQYNESYHVACDVLESVCGQRVIKYNDAYGRMHSQIMAKFDEAIAKAEGK